MRVIVLKTRDAIRAPAFRIFILFCDAISCAVKSPMEL